MNTVSTVVSRCNVIKIAVLAIILQCINVTPVHLKLIPCYMSNVFNKTEFKKINVEMKKSFPRNSRHFQKISKVFLRASK